MCSQGKTPFQKVFVNINNYKTSFHQMRFPECSPLKVKQNNEKKTRFSLHSLSQTFPVLQVSDSLAASHLNAWALHKVQRT